MSNPSHLRVVGQTSPTDAEQEALNLVFAALSDPVRREILDRLDGHDLPTSAKEHMSQAAAKPGAPVALLWITIATESWT